MKISTRGRYGLRALVELANCNADQCMSLREIANRHGMSENYLEQLFVPLKKAGLVVSVRGAQGGYKLNRPAETITAADIIQVLEGSLSPADCIEDANYECPAATCDTCHVKTVWQKLYLGITEILGTIRLSDLAAESLNPNAS
ncbi:MAG: Rrf2 family transcriptional regulator [Defluviitaleaceae bacterium]|nr:Rrf2 family transcriptional regulator [Defluviitaleaceae bacterium]